MDAKCGWIMICICVCRVIHSYNDNMYKIPPQFGEISSRSPENTFDRI